MAQKAAKTLAATNTHRLNTTHLITLLLHTLYLLLRALLFRSTFTRRSFLLYTIFSLPALFIEFWFERVARPRYGSAPGRELRSAGEDLDAKGLTEWMWDVLYWTWGCLGVAALVGNWAWWGYAAIPIYSLYLAYTAVTGARMAGLAGAGGEGGHSTQASSSKRQAKLEKRGGQRVQYR